MAGVGMKVQHRNLVSQLFGAALALSLLSSRPAPLAPEPAAVPRVAAAFAAPAGYIVEGAHISPVLDYPIEIHNFETAVGRPAGIIMYFRPWDRLTVDPKTGAGPCDDGFLPRQVDAGFPVKPGDPNGHVIMITWEPLSGIIGTPGPAAFDNILNHQFDSLIDACANELKAWSNKLFLIRLMHEMNIPSEPWGTGYSYNQKPDGTTDTGKFQQVWRYVWQRFHNLGVKNVQWVWSPNFASNPDVPWNNMNNYYPGDQYVDWIGLSGYNWMGAIPFQSYSFLYDKVLTDLQCRYAKPIMHAEIASAPYAGNFIPQDQVSWIADAYQRAQTFPLVRAVVWFNDHAYHSASGPDFRVFAINDPAYPNDPGVPQNITDAYANAIQGSAYTSNYNSAQLLNPPMTRCPGDVVSGNGVLSARPATAMIGKTGGTSARFDIGAFGLGSDTTFTIRGCPPGATCHFVSSGSPRSSNQPAPWSGDVLVVTAGPDTHLGTFTLTINGDGTSVQFQVTVVQSIIRNFMPAIFS